MKNTPLRGNMVKTWIFPSGGHAFAVVHVLPTQALRSRRVSPNIEASRRTRIPSPPAKSPVFVLWLNQVTQRFCGEPPQTPRMCRLQAWAATLHQLMSTTSSCFSCHHVAALDLAQPLGPSRQAYLSLHSLEARQDYDLSCLLFTCTNANQAATCTCTYNTQPRVSPHHVVNHSSLKSDHPPVFGRSGPQSFI
jgi:hypothetical protein